MKTATTVTKTIAAGRALGDGIIKRSQKKVQKSRHLVRLIIQWCIAASTKGIEDEEPKGETRNLPNFIFNHNLVFNELLLLLLFLTFRFFLFAIVFFSPRE